jgi:hypothetical protein
MLWPSFGLQRLLASHKQDEVLLRYVLTAYNTCSFLQASKYLSYAAFDFIGKKARCQEQEYSSIIKLLVGIELCFCHHHHYQYTLLYNSSINNIFIYFNSSPTSKKTNKKQPIYKSVYVPRCHPPHPSSEKNQTSSSSHKSPS